MIITTAKEMRPRDSADFYPTPLDVCHAAIALLPEPARPPMRILDPGAGSGPWGIAIARRWGFARIHGIELRDVPRPLLYSSWEQASFIDLPNPKPPKPTGDPLKDERARQQYQFDLWASQQPIWRAPATPFDLVVGNPPYKHAEMFVRTSLAHTRSSGYVCFLLRLAFLEGQDRAKGLWEEHPPLFVAVCGSRPSFTGNGKTDATAYAMFVWQKDWHGTPALTWLK